MLRQIFDGFDYDGVGDIAAGDLKKALYYIYDNSEEGFGARRSERDRKFREISDMVDEIDNDGSGEIDFDEFCEYMTSQEGGGGNKSKGGGPDIQKLQDLFVNHQRGVQLDLLTAHSKAKRADEMNVAELMKSFEFLFKTHMAGAGAADEEAEAKKLAEASSRRYYLTATQRADGDIGRRSRSGRRSRHSRRGRRREHSTGGGHNHLLTSGRRPQRSYRSREGSLH